jgi:hypothetical protein
VGEGQPGGDGDGLEGAVLVAAAAGIDWHQPRNQDRNRTREAVQHHLKPNRADSTDVPKGLGELSDGVMSPSVSPSAHREP